MTKHPPMHHPLKHVLIWLRINYNLVVGLTTIYVVQCKPSYFTSQNLGNYLRKWVSQIIRLGM
jgi:hypothetical protein